MQIKTMIWGTSMIALTACGGSQVATTAEAEPVVVKTTDHLVMATLWFQSSMEAKFIFEQSYKLAEKMMMANLDRVRSSKPAIIIDIDETVLDNSPYEARLIKQGKPFDPQSWAEWVKEANAKALPGAADFLSKAEASGVEVFYISNRSADLLDPTIQNLQILNLPFADPEHILLKEDGSSSKEERREMVKSKVRVILLVGDQLADFSEQFERSMSADEIMGEQPDMQDSIKKNFVLLPNPMYGTFESALYPEGRTLTDKEKVEFRIKALNRARGEKR